MSDFRIAISSAFILAGLVGCDSPRGVAGPADDRPLPTECAAIGGTEHSGSVPAGAWAAADGPHRITGNVGVGTLEIEAGSLICAAAGARIDVNRLVAEGTADAPIIFTALDTLVPWGGIAGVGAGSSVEMAHVRLEHALQGFTAAIGGHTTVRSSLFRKLQGAGLVAGDNGSVEMIDLTIDSACLTLCAEDRAAVQTRGFMDVHFEDSHILNSGSGGMLVAGLTQAILLGGSIEGSAGIGLVLWPSDNRPVRIVDARSIRISGGASYPARMTLTHAAALLRSPEAHAAWMGNEQDTVLVHAHGSFGADSLTIRPGLAWVIYGQPWGSGATALDLYPGAHLTVHDRLLVQHMTSHGTADEPVTVVGASAAGPGTSPGWIQLFGAAGDTSRLRYAHLHDIRIDGASGNATLTVEDVSAWQSQIRLGVPGSRLTRTALHGVRDDLDAILVLSGDGISVTACEVTGSSADGITVEGGSDVVINGCNIHDNAGIGLSNFGAATVDATENWWGSAEGPLGPGGDGVQGDVMFEPFRTAPAEAGPAH